MANVTIAIPDALVPRLVAAMRATFPQHAALTDANAFKRVTADYWRGVLADHESEAAASTARGAVSGAYAAALTAATIDGAGIG